MNVAGSIPVGGSQSRPPRHLLGRNDQDLASHLFDQFAQIVEQVIEASREGYDLFFNLCDGAWDEGRVGIEVVQTARPDEALRRDLVAQLNVITLRVPALREYAEDVPDLLRHYVDRLVDEEKLAFRRFSVAAQNRLRNYPWPANVRELRNLVQRLLIVGGAEEISLEEIERELAVQQPAEEPLVKQDLLALPLREAREQFERAYLMQQLILCNGKVGQLAKRVGMERTHLYRKLRALGVDFRQITEED